MALMANPSRSSLRKHPAWLVGVCLAAFFNAGAQNPDQPPLPQNIPGMDEAHTLVDQYPDHPSPPPAFSIPAGPLGYSVPGPIYETRLYTMVSLDFLDESHLLFTFHVSSGLMQRDSPASEETERHIRAIVVSLPDGKIDAQDTWVLHDRMRYLWMLRDGHFLLRDAGGLKEGDASLKLKPFVQFDGHLLWIQMDPDQHFLITNSLLPADAPLTRDEAAQTGAQADPQATLTVRTLSLPSGEVFRTSRLPWTYQTSDWPVNSDGYVEPKSAGPRKWNLDLNYFAGGSRTIATVPSTCAPTTSYLSGLELFVTTCDPEGGWKLNAILAKGAFKWQQHASTNAVWPLLVTSPDGYWFARETLVLSHPLNGHHKHYDMHDVRGQLLRVFNAWDGKLVLEAPLQPLMLSGGNVAFSPSGRRLAVLSGTSIDLYDLAAPTFSPNDVNN